MDDLNARFEDWRTTIANPLVNATTQRIMDTCFAKKQHHAAVVQIEGASYRLRQHADLIPDHTRARRILSIRISMATPRCECPSEPNLPRKTQIGEDQCDHPGCTTYLSRPFYSCNRILPG